MEKSELSQYIKKQLDQGKKKVDLYKELLSQGMTPTEIDSVFEIQDGDNGKSFTFKSKKVKKDLSIGNELIIVLLVFVFPVGVFLMWTKSDWKALKKILITVIPILFFVILSIFWFFFLSDVYHETQELSRNSQSIKLNKLAKEGAKNDESTEVIKEDKEKVTQSKKIIEQDDNNDSLFEKEPTERASALASYFVEYQDEDIVYNLNYFNMDVAEEKNLVKPGKVEIEKIDVIETTLRRLNFDPAIINKYAIVFISPQVKSPGIVYGVLFDGQQSLVGELEEGSNGNVNPQQNNVVLSNVMGLRELEAVFLHELGHVIFDLLSADEVSEFMLIRGYTQAEADEWVEYLNDKTVTKKPPIYMTSWSESPQEDFAEVFKSIYFEELNSTFWEVKTVKGPVLARQKEWMLKIVAPKFMVER